MNGFYNNTLDDFLAASDAAGATAELDWAQRQLIGTDWNHHALYCATSLLSKSLTPGVVRSAYQRRLRLGLAYSTTKEVDALLTYNTKQTDPACRLTFGVTEYEPYQSGQSYDYMTALLEANAPRLRAAGLQSRIYCGWMKSDYWPTLVAHADDLLVHCYLSSANMAKGTAIWSYLCADSGGYNRLPRIAAAAKAAGKIQRVTLLFSCEPTFGYSYYQTAPWTAPRDLFLQQWASKATAEMKQWLVVGDVTTFVSKYARQCKP